MKKYSNLRFPQNTLVYLKQLSKNNNREWFEAHRQDYEENFFQPAVQFVLDMGEKLEKIRPEIHAIPKIDKSIFRLHRDTRFSKSKEPYKTNLGIYFWEGSGKKMDDSGYYFHIEPEQLFLGVGLYLFPKDMLAKYRESMSNPQTNRELGNLLKKLNSKNEYRIGGKKYKKVPKGCNPDVPYPDLLLHDTLFMAYELSSPEELMSESIVSFAFEKFKKLTPLHEWLVNLQRKS